MPSQILLSEAQRLEFTSVPETITDDELEYFYSLRDEDIQIVNTHRGDENRLGFAMTICCLRHKGWPYSAMVSVAPKVISFVAGQIGAPATCISRYGENKSTRYNILLNVVVIWNTVYLTRAIEHKLQTAGLDDSLLKHISPLNWNHIQLYGKYYFNEESSLEDDQYRELKLPEPSDNPEGVK